LRKLALNLIELFISRGGSQA